MVFWKMCESSLSDSVTNDHNDNYKNPRDAVII
jgi:hypothetical protein